MFFLCVALSPCCFPLARLMWSLDVSMLRLCNGHHGFSRANIYKHTRVYLYVYINVYTIESKKYFVLILMQFGVEKRTLITILIHCKNEIQIAYFFENFVVVVFKPYKKRAQFYVSLLFHWLVVCLFVCLREVPFWNVDYW